MRRATRGWVRYRLALVGGPRWIAGFLLVLLLAPLINFTAFPLPMLVSMLGFAIAVIAWLRWNPGESAFDSCLPIAYAQRLSLCFRLGASALLVVFLVDLAAAWLAARMPWPAVTAGVGTVGLAGYCAFALVAGLLTLLAMNVIGRLLAWLRLVAGVGFVLLLVLLLVFSRLALQPVSLGPAWSLLLVGSFWLLLWSCAPLMARVWPRPATDGQVVAFNMAAQPTAGGPPADGLVAPFWQRLLPRRLPARWRVWWTIFAGSGIRSVGGLGILIIIGIALFHWIGSRLFLDWFGIGMLLLIAGSYGMASADRPTVQELSVQHTWGEALARLFGRQRLVGRFVVVAAASMLLVIALALMIDMRGWRQPADLPGSAGGLVLADYHAAVGIERSDCRIPIAGGWRSLSQERPERVEPEWLAEQARRLLWREHGVQLPLAAFAASGERCPWPIAATGIRSLQWRFDLVGAAVGLAALLAAYAAHFRSRGNKPLVKLLYLGSVVALNLGWLQLWLRSHVSVDPAIGYPEVTVGLVGHWRALVVERTWWLVAAAAVVALLALAVIWRRARWLRLAP